MARLPSTLTLDTRHAWSALMGGPEACGKLLAAKLHEAAVAAGVMPEDAPVAINPAMRPAQPDGGTAAAPPRPMVTISSSSPSDEGGRTTAPGAAFDGTTVTIKGEDVPLEHVLDLWYEADSIAQIGEVLGCSSQTVMNVGKRLDLPGRFSDAWIAIRDRRRAEAPEAADPVPQPDSAPGDDAGDDGGPADDVDAHDDPSRPAAPVEPPAAPPWPAKPVPRTHCQFVIAADRNGAQTCRMARLPGQVYCSDHLAQVQAERGRG